MRWLRRFRYRPPEDDLQAEMRFHLDEEVRLRVERGETPDRARSAAYRVFGNVAVAQETTRDVWAWARLVSAWRTLSLTLRSFSQAPGFTLAAILTVALGVGANTLAFSMFDRVLFRPLPYSEPERLVQLQSNLGAATAAAFDDAGMLRRWVTYALANEPGLFAGIAWADGGQTIPMTPVASENPVLWLTPVTFGTLDVLGVRPLIGRGFSTSDSSDTQLSILLTYETWQSRYGGADSVLSLEWTAPHRVGAQSANARWRVIGVLPKGFLLPSSRLGRQHDDGIYGVDPHFDRPPSTSEVTIAPFARLAPGVSLADARARVNTIVTAIQPGTTVAVLPMQTGLSEAVRPYVWLAGVGGWIVLGATCLTLAILLLTWSHSRRQDAGVRLALGASTRQLVASAVLETTLLCGAGACVGWLVYAWTRSLFISAMPLGLRPFATDTADFRVVVATGCAAIITAAAASVLPAIRTSRMSPLDAIRRKQDAALLDRLEGGPVLLAAQAALGVILLVGAWATVPAVVGFLRKAPGFDAADLYQASIPTSDDTQARNALEQTRRGLVLLDIARQLPGVTGATLSETDPFGDDVVQHSFSKRLAPAGFEGRVLAVGPKFFSTLATPMIAGRPFSATELAGQAAVAVVNERAARVLWPDSSAAAVIGRTVTTAGGPRRVVGVSADVHLELNDRADPVLFLPGSANEVYGRAATWHEFQLILRMAPGRTPEMALLARRLREQSWMIQNWVGPGLQSVSAQLEPAREKPRLLSAIYSMLGGVILVVTTLAVYGLASFETRRRREEMTVRLALGATPGALRRTLTAVILTPVIAGACAGLPLSWVEVKVLSLSVPLVNASDVRVYGLSALVMVLAAAVAAWLSGRRFSTMRAAELLHSP